MTELRFTSNIRMTPDINISVTLTVLTDIDAAQDDGRRANEIVSRFIQGYGEGIIAEASA